MRRLAPRPLVLALSPLLRRLRLVRAAAALGEAVPRDAGDAVRRRQLDAQYRQHIYYSKEGAEGGYGVGGGGCGCN